MGSSQNKDPTVRIYITLSKRLYIAGEFVEGVVHLDCKANRPYTHLYIKLNGSESIHWEETYNKTHVHYTNFVESYKQEFLLATFNLGVKTGQYSFPFSLLLPSVLPASFVNEFDDDNFIKYAISAYLPAYDENSSTQLFERSLHVRQPCRLMEKTFRQSSIVEAKCCGFCCNCCCVCGSAELSFESQTDLLQNQPFLAKGVIDNTRGTTLIKRFKVVLRQCLKKISESQFVNTSNNEFVLFSSQNQVPVGSSLPFQTQITIPLKVLNHSAIGNIIYRAHFLQLVAQVKCCYSNPTLSRFVIVNNSIQPPIEKQQLEKAPQGWNPVIANPITFLNLKPYMYIPLKDIDVQNRAVAINPINSLNSASMNQLIS